MDKEFEKEMEQKIIGNMLFKRVEEICEELINHCERAKIGGINRFALKTYLLTAARHGYNTALSNLAKTASESSPVISDKELIEFADFILKNDIRRLSPSDDWMSEYSLIGSDSELLTIYRNQQSKKIDI